MYMYFSCFRGSLEDNIQLKLHSVFLKKKKNVFEIVVPESHVRQQEIPGGIPHR